MANVHQSVTSSSPRRYEDFTRWRLATAMLASLSHRRKELDHMHRLRHAAICAAVGAGAALIPATASAKTTISMSGSTSVAPLAAKLARGYLKAFPNSSSFRLAQGGSDIGVADVARGRVTIGNSSRDPKPTDPGGLVFNKIARDAICIATNKGNAVSNLSQAQIQAIFSGQVRNWSEIPGSGANGAIDVVVRTAASGTQDAFQKIFLGSSKVYSGASQKASNGLVAQSISKDPNAIGYVSLAFTKGLNDARYKGVACTLRNAKSGQYEGTRNFWMVTRGAATGAAKKFIKWVQDSTAAQKIIARGWVPLK
jgi:phosphate transport system substrate-binding protein